MSDGTGIDLLKAFGAALIPVVFSYGGWQRAACVAGEMKDARHILARALVVGVVAVVAIYLLVNLAFLRVLGVGALEPDAHADAGCPGPRIDRPGSGSRARRRWRCRPWGSSVTAL